MSALMGKIKKFFDGWCSCGSGKKAAQPAGGAEEAKPQQAEAQPKACRSDEEPEEHQGL